jgi:DNA-binding SARP family transcriptional activator/DNA-binding beta-propeller fold protein YncE
MEFRLLGPFEVLEQGREVDVGGGRQQALLALLLLRRNEVVPIDELIEQLWDGAAPASARQVVQNYVLRLRKAVGADRVETQAGGYRLRVAPAEVDGERARLLVAEGRAALEHGDAARGERLLTDALELWRGDPLGDFRYAEFAQAEITSLEERRLEALEVLAEARLALGKHREMIADLRRLVSDNPLRERPRAQLMLALYRAGRQADALAVYREGRQALLDEVGLEPSQSLQELERAILNQDPELGRTDLRTSAPSRRRRRIALIVFALSAAAAIAGAILLLTGSPGRALSQVPPNSVVQVDPASGRARRVYKAGVTPVALNVTRNAIWVANFDDKTVSRIPRGHASTTAVGIGSTPTGLAHAGDAIWAISSFGQIDRVDTATGEVAAVIHTAPGLSAAAAGSQAVWITNKDAGTLLRLNRRTNSVATAVRSLRDPSGVAVGAGYVWVAEAGARRIDGIDPRSGRIAIRSALRLTPDQLAFGAGALWATDPVDDLVIRIDPSSLRRQLISVGRHPAAIAVGHHWTWIVNDLDHSLYEIDAATGVVTRKIVLSVRDRVSRNPITPGGVATDGDDVWISVQSY